MKQLPSLESLHLNLSYDPIGGDLRWRQTGELFGSENSRGYLAGDFENVSFLVHRIVFKMMTGEEPEIIDHINGRTKDNSWKNFRNVSIQLNNKNKAIPKNNTSGRIGVSIDPGGRFRAHICVKGKRITLGRFDNISDAIAARVKAEKENDFHPNHGKRWNL